ncbi:MAG: SlyX family protein [Succinivibrio sp.]|nr:SlyX family protein [Succinivibrio sp.]
MNSSTEIIALEEKIAWLENQLEEQGEQLNRALNELAALRQEFAHLYQKVSDPYAVRSLKDEVPPPHY